MSNKGIRQGLVEVLRAGKHTTRESIAKAAGIEPDQIATYLSALRLAGRIEYTNVNARKIDYASIRVVGDAPAPTPRKAAARTPMAKPAKAAPAAPQGTGDGLADSISVTYTPAEIEALGDLSDKLAALVAVLRAQPKLGPKGAAAMNLIAQLMAGG